MSRLKLLLLVLIIAVLGIVFVQNREPLALKMLCPDRTQSCIYQTPALPLAVWIALFTIGGMITSLLLQLLDRYRYSGSAKRKYATEDLQSDRPYGYENDDQGDRQDRYSTAANNIKEDTTTYTTNSYEKPQEPQSVEVSGSTYSYKYRDKKDDDSTQKTSLESNIDLDKDDKDDDEEWI